MNLLWNDGHGAIFTHRFFTEVIFFKVTEKHHLNIKNHGQVCYYYLGLGIPRKNSIYLNYLQDYSEGGKKKSGFNDQISRKTECNLN